MGNDEVAAKLAAVLESVEAARVEGAARGREQEAFNKRIELNLDAQRGEIKTLAARVRRLEDSDAAITRDQSDTNLEHEAAIGGAIAHVAKLEGAVTKVDEKIDTTREAVKAHLDAQDRALADVKKTLAKQNESAGLDLRGVQWATSKGGRNTLVAIATLAAAIYSAIQHHL